MKIINLSTLDSGGAGIAALRFNKTLIEAGYDSRLIVKQKNTNYDFVIQANKSRSVSYKKKIVVFLKKIVPITIYRKIRVLTDNASKTVYAYSFNNFYETERNGLCKELDVLIGNADVIFVHFIADFINTYDLMRVKKKFGCRIIFTMMDLSPVTGGCHYPWDCSGYKKNCLNCPALPQYLKGLANNQLLVKSINIAGLEAEIIASTVRDFEIAKTSSIPFKKYWKHNIIIAQKEFMPDTNLLKQTKEFYIINNANITNDIRKGFDYFIQTLLILDKYIPKDVKIKVLCLDNKYFSNYHFYNICFEKFEYCYDSLSLANLYKKADIFLCTSIEDSGPMMLVEALLCGVPVIAFDTGIASEIIELGKEGYVVAKYDVIRMAELSFEILFKPNKNLMTYEERHNSLINKFSEEKFLKGINNILLSSK